MYVFAWYKVLNLTDSYLVMKWATITLANTCNERVNKKQDFKWETEKNQRKKHW